MHLVVVIFDPASEDDSILESFGDGIMSSSKDFLGGAANGRISSYKVVQYLQPDVFR